MSTASTVVNNSLVLLGGSITTQIINLLYVGVLARYLGVDGFGQISTATALIAVVFIFVNYGFDMLLVRELAADLKRAPSYISNAIYIRLSFVMCISLVLPLILGYSPYSEQTKTIIWIYGLVNALDSMSNAITSIFNAYQRMGYRAAIELGRQIVNVGVSLIGISLGWSLVQLVWVSAFASSLRLLATYIVAKSRFINFNWRLNVQLYYYLIRIAFPFFISLLLNVLGLRLLVIILSWLDTEVAVGLYSAALLPIITILYIPDMIGDAVFPVMSRSHTNAPDTLAKTYQLFFRLLMIIGFPMGVGAMLISPEVMGIVYGSGFELATTLFIILSAYLFTIATYANGLFLAATKRQKIFNTLRLSFTVTGSVLSILFIPLFSYFGAAVVFIFTAFGEFVVLTMISHRYLGLSFPWESTIKIVLSSALMGIVGYLIRENDLPVLTILFISPVIYMFGLLVTKVLTTDDWRIIQKLPVGGGIHRVAKYFRLPGLI